MCLRCIILFFFCKQKTADELRISDWSSDVCSSDLDSFERYQREEAWTWEHMALLRARAVYGTDTARDDQRIGRARDQLHAIGEAPLADPVADDLGRASCRERVCPYVSITGVAVFFK